MAFGNRYFAQRYFADRYFPPGSFGIDSGISGEMFGTVALFESLRAGISVTASLKPVGVLGLSSLDALLFSEPAVSLEAFNNRSAVDATIVTYDATEIDRIAAQSDTAIATATGAIEATEISDGSVTEEGIDGSGLIAPISSKPNMDGDGK